MSPLILPQIAHFLKLGLIWLASEGNNKNRQMMMQKNPKEQKRDEARREFMKTLKKDNEQYKKMRSSFLSYNLFINSQRQTRHVRFNE